MKTFLLAAVLSLPQWSTCARCQGTGVAWFAVPAVWGWMPVPCACDRCGTFGREYRRGATGGRA